MDFLNLLREKIDLKKIQIVHRAKIAFFLGPKIQRIFKIYKGKKFPTRFSILLSLKNYFAKIG